MKSQCKQCNSDFWRQTSRYRWKFGCLQACRLSKPIVCTSNMMLLTSHRIQNTSNEAWKQAKSKKRPKSADLVVLRLSQREKNEKSHYLEEESIFFKILSTAFLSTWMQTYLRPTSLNVDLVRRNFDFCVFLVLGGPEFGPLGPPYKQKNTKQDVAQNRRGVWRSYFVGAHC